MSEDDKKVPGAPGKNPFEAYADDVDNKMTVGSLLKFVKGDWLVGRDKEELAERELVAVVSGLMHGWLRWENNRPTGHAMGLLVEGFIPPKRDVLGDLDRAQWIHPDDRRRMLEAVARAHDPQSDGFAPRPSFAARARRGTRCGPSAVRRTLPGAKRMKRIASGCRSS